MLTFLLGLFVGGLVIGALGRLVAPLTRSAFGGLCFVGSAAR